MRASGSLLYVLLVAATSPAVVHASSIPKEMIGTVSTQNSIAKALTYSSFAQSTYDDLDMPGYKRINWADLMREKGVSESKIGAIRDSGFSANIYLNRQTNDAVIAFAGTDVFAGQRSDMPANAANALNRTSTQYEAAALLAKLSMGSGMRASCTGHSLGGGLCQRAAIETGIQGVTFNAAPVGGVTDGQRRAANVFNFRTRGDVAGLSANGAGYAGHVIEMRAPASLADALAKAAPAFGPIGGYKALERHQLASIVALSTDVRDGRYAGPVQFFGSDGKKQTYSIQPERSSTPSRTIPRNATLNALERLPDQRNAASAIAPPSASAARTPAPPGTNLDQASGKAPSLQANAKRLNDVGGPPLSPQQAGGDQQGPGNSSASAAKTGNQNLGPGPRISGYEAAIVTNSPVDPTAAAANGTPRAQSTPSDQPGGLRGSTVQELAKGEYRIGAPAGSSAKETTREQPGQASATRRTTQVANGGIQVGSGAVTPAPDGEKRLGAYANDPRPGDDEKLGGVRTDNSTLDRLKQQLKQSDVNMRATAQTGAMPRVASREQSGVPQGYRQELLSAERERQQREEQRRAQAERQRPPPGTCWNNVDRDGAIECTPWQQPERQQQDKVGWACQQPDGSYVPGPDGEPILIRGSRPNFYCWNWVQVDMSAFQNESCEQRQAREDAALKQKYGSNWFFHAGGRCLEAIRAAP